MAENAKSVSKTNEEELKKVEYVDVKPADKKKYIEIGDILKNICDAENGINLFNNMVAMSILEQGIKAIYIYLSNNRSKDETVSVNIGDYLELGIECRQSDDEEKEANFAIYAIPGSKGKLFSKSDDESEEE